MSNPLPIFSQFSPHHTVTVVNSFQFSVVTNIRTQSKWKRESSLGSKSKRISVEKKDFCVVGWNLIISRIVNLSLSFSLSSSSPHHITIQLPSKRDQNFIIDFLSSSTTSLEKSSSYPLNPRQTHTSAYHKKHRSDPSRFSCSCSSLYVFIIIITTPRKSSSLRYFWEIIIVVVVVVDVVVVLNEAKDEKGRKTI